MPIVETTYKHKLLDLFCGAGGAAMGYHRAGFEVVGVDHLPQKHYPFEFHCADAFAFLEKYGQEFDVIHASPPCQGYSRLRHLPWLKERTWPLLIEPLRNRLQEIGRPYVIENVEDAPLAGFVLCGQMFDLPLYRHRKFETSWLQLVGECPGHHVVVGHGRMVNDRRKGSSAKGAWGKQEVVTVAGGQFKKADGERALGIHWMSKDELADAVPPAYTEWIGRQLLGVTRNSTMN